MDLLKKLREQPSERGAERDARQNGYGRLPEHVEIETPAARHSQKRREQQNDEYVVRGGARRDHLRNAFIGAVAFPFEFQHSRHDHGGGNCRHHAA